MSKESFGESLFGRHSDVAKLPKYTINNEANASLWQVYLFRRSALLTEQSIPYRADVVEKKEWKVINEIFDQKISWIRDNLGLDVSSRRTGKIKLYPYEEWAKYCEDRNEMSLNGLTNKYRQIFSNKDSSTLKANLCHESIHSLANMTIHIEKEKGKDHADIPCLGFFNFKTDKMRYFNECLTEMINQESSSVDQRKKGWGVSYFDGVTFFNIVNEETASRLGRDPKSLRHDLYRGYFTGDMTVLDIYDRAFGEGTLEKIAEMKESQYSSRDLHELGISFGIREMTLQGLFDRNSGWDNIERIASDQVPVLYNA